MANPPRIWLSSETPAAGEIVRVRAQVVHIMESGLRLDAAGNAIPRDTLERFSATLGDDVILDWFPETAISQNPYIEFTFKARESGVLKMIWSDQNGVLAEAERAITLS
ncbi:thiosulfate oxidation carrier complex protein SoxZ [Xinfangfangia sp. D13-10-4-6]|uniref:thiosulfate oxidation carrier complex protein SoxZ n=1 Tax=Pseudogemmobacter hezensis TaxID=2737662 RepID=UPI001554E5FA|nr:thiosulfate oxidation carrier complex protein SoxZ [Pseudogemmobacter hezensis]NPD17670.1 thiosulfate oxidation carrier complex protein SoxZ [Pseudogemmobacter hezensis]